MRDGLCFIKINLTKDYWSTPYGRNPAKFVNVFPCHFPDSMFETLRKYKFDTLREVKEKGKV